MTPEEQEDELKRIFWNDLHYRAKRLGRYDITVMLMLFRLWPIFLLAGLIGATVVYVTL